jgi:hypothetical protein
MVEARRYQNLALSLGCALLFLSLEGCTYLKYRGQDAMEIIDLGVTVSKKPGFAFYYDFIPVIPIGVGYVDGYFAGLGGGKFGAMKHYEESYGAILWGQEEVGFGVYDLESPASVRFQRTGLIGVFQGPVPGPDYMISCPHYLHLGWIGLVASPRYLQILDFIVGFSTLDFCHDDGAEIGTWSPAATPATP